MRVYCNTTYLQKKRTTPLKRQMLTLQPWTSTHNSSAKAQIQLQSRKRGATSDCSLLPCLADKVFHRTISMRLFSSPLTLWHIDFLRSYKANTASAETIVVDEGTGEEKKRLINRMRWKGFGPTSVSYSNKNVCLTTEGPGLGPFADMRWTGAGQAQHGGGRATRRS